MFTNTSVDPEASDASLRERGELVLGRHRDEAMVGLLHEPQLAEVDLVPHRVARVHVRHPADRAVERGGEEHGLAILRKFADDPIHLRLEPHVQHPVGFVEHEDLHAVEPNEPAFHEVVQPPRRRDQDVRRPDAFRLLAHVRPAVHGHDPKVLRVGDVLEGVADLLGELARRGEHECDGPAIGVGIDLIDDGDREPQGLAGARLRPRQRVSSGGRILDDHDLDRERGLDAARCQGANDFIGYTQVTEGRHRVQGLLRRAYRPEADRRARPVV